MRYIPTGYRQEQAIQWGHLMVDWGMTFLMTGLVQLSGFWDRKNGLTWTHLLDFGDFNIKWRFIMCPLTCLEWNVLVTFYLQAIMGLVQMCRFKTNCFNNNRIRVSKDVVPWQFAKLSCSLLVSAMKNPRFHCSHK